MSKKAIVFDFDGTLADTSRFVQEIDDTDYQLLRTNTLWRTIRFAPFRAWRLYVLWQEAKRRIGARTNEVILFPGIEKLILKLYKEGWDIYVLSNNRRETVQTVMQQHNLTDYLTVLGQPLFFAKSIPLKRLLKRMGYKRTHMWMIGDEVTDIRAAKRAGISSIGVSWGLQYTKLLEAAKADAIADKPKDIYDIITAK
jgi:phosphoglycolate phosphatase